MKAMEVQQAFQEVYVKWSARKDENGFLKHLRPSCKFGG